MGISHPEGKRQRRERLIRQHNAPWEPTVRFYASMATRQNDMSDDIPSATCPMCGEWIPCQHPILVVDPQYSGRPDRWISLEKPDQALDRHLRRGCTK